MHLVMDFFIAIMTLLAVGAYHRSFNIKRRYYLIAIFGCLVMMGPFMPVDVPADEILHEPN
jgi:hypothetical protein